MSEKTLQAGPHLKIADDFLKHTVLRLIPHSISPNTVTTVRFISVPVIAILLLLQSYGWGTFIFALSAFTDALDGAMARTRHRITRWGIIADPLADKLLIGTTAIILVTRYVDLKVALFLVGIELLLIMRALYMRTRGRNAQANVIGKTKMVLQSIALLVLFAYVVSGAPLFLASATYILYAAIFFAFLSLFPGIFGLN
ncbi:MAG: CDP-alcohol phosphatidyltransferase family protein [Candidatus Kaiserbacteria bacterium]|nr:CDP-alcohol phosphatidyltransferase family protein [Candidatus Kaiserbacteria bacterium]